MTSDTSRKELRKRIRQQRRNLSPQAQKQASEQLKKVFCQEHLLKRGQHIAIYLANDGEIDPQRIIELCWQTRRHCYLPVLHPTAHNCLWFYRYQRSTQLKKNRFGIAEPALRNQRRMPAWAINTVLMPLVAFDARGGRLGMGGGFYDRTFAFSQKRRGPRLLGLAHHFQQTECLPIEPWDVPLQAIITDKQCWKPTF